MCELPKMNGAIGEALSLYGAPDLDIILRRKVPSSFILQNVRHGDIAPSNDRDRACIFPVKVAPTGNMRDDYKGYGMARFQRSQQMASRNEPGVTFEAPLKQRHLVLSYEATYP